MPKRITITVDTEIFHGLHDIVGHRRISRFLNNLARPQLVQQSLAAGYAAMAADKARKAEAAAWETLAVDVADERTY